MGRKSHSRKYLSATTSFVLIGIIVIPSCAYAPVSASNYPKNYYHTQANSYSNSSGAVFEARDGDGGGGGGSSYAVPLAAATSFGSMGGGGGYDSGGYGAPVMPSPTIYKYEIRPSPPMQMGWGGWGEDEDGDFDFDIPKEIIGLLGLKGLKGLKPLKGALVLLKGALFLKKLLKIPLLPILLPLLLPLFLLKLLLILFIPIPLLLIPAGRKLPDLAGKSFKKYFEDKIDVINIPEDILHIVEKIKSSSQDISWRKVLSKYLDSTETAGESINKKSKFTAKFGETGIIKSKVGYVAALNATNIKQSSKLSEQVSKKP